jgi:hypothetical protein
MASTVMILHLPQLLLPQRLGSITSVEMLWHLRLFQDSEPHDPLDSGLAGNSQPARRPAIDLPTPQEAVRVAAGRH